ncbi:hypothetical protein DAEQUDRAFT_771559 [Daedalea quercina L-15889]|uniref:RBR-type E3 ubiquitin transferase n=1 Tax=Daedalea quercina L-15889 TaxID=1314783 RepID=A0A165UF03_9APHY|nr:hypothetical protein DAEQUDRAFT_771559 [Daedalea quercina L-15889]
MVGESSSSSSSLAPEDSATYIALVAQFALQDIDDISATRKGKASALAPKSDEEIAFELFAEEANSLLALTRDIAFARSIDDALQTDHDILQEIIREDEVARSDREYALAVQAGRPPPPTFTPNSVILSNVCFFEQDTNSINEQFAQAHQHTQVSFLKSGDLPPLITSYRKEMCVFCRDQIAGTEIHAPCGHFWDTHCLVELFRAATTDETLFPPRCCQKSFVLKEVQQYLGAGLLSTFKAISAEFGTANRVYCHRPTCSAFICAATETSSVQVCPRCLSQTCGRCKEQAHLVGADALFGALWVVVMFLALAKQEGWARCPGCKHLVELAYGCYHMTCRCRKEFCYVCAETWKNCTCPQWDEGRLYVTARNQVERELAAGPPPAAPQYQRMVREAAERLRVDHDCRHRWVYRPGAGRCENCSFYLPQFLLSCKNCHMNVCVRCRRNRM